MKELLKQWKLELKEDKALLRLMKSDLKAMIETPSNSYLRTIERLENKISFNEKSINNN
tara:strand:+ start:3992 stop:4168 length:177 start_codon:yes stop_codon:yes gene_type:complete